MPFKTIPKDYIAWTAGENPAPGKMVKVMYADGAISIPSKSEVFTSSEGRKNYWRHEVGGHFNIIAYKVIP